MDWVPWSRREIEPLCGFKRQNDLRQYKHIREHSSSGRNSATADPAATAGSRGPCPDLGKRGVRSLADGPSVGPRTVPGRNPTRHLRWPDLRGDRGFAIPSTRLGGVLAIGSTYELNVRLYSIDSQRRQGVV